MKVGFIGLGAMGRPMALHLLRAGHELAVHARRPAAADFLAARGAAVCDSPRALAARCEVVFTMVTSSEDVAGVALGEDGVIAGAAAGSVLVDCSTIAPSMARHVAGRLGERGVAMLDTPVSGGPQGAQDATLAIMVGGDPAVLERVRPLLAVLGRSIVHVGPAGAGQVAKACNQMIMVAAIEACAEAVHLARAAGVDPARVVEALAGGSAGSRVLEVFGARMARRDFAAGIEARLHHKDFGLLLREAWERDLALPLMAQVGQQLSALMALGYGKDDTSSLLRVLETASGQSARAQASCCP
jgi:2-hydroxy-3-oxopropionate reductase